MSAHAEPAPVRTVPFFTPGTLVLIGIALVGLVFAAIRYAAGLGAVTNIDEYYPWGIGKAFNVATLVAFGAGGFTTTALVHVFHRERFHSVVRPALLIALLCYTFVGLGLLFDLGKYYNIWHPLIYWQGNSVLFEVGMCVMAYLTVQYIEFLPAIAERFPNGVHMRGPLKLFNRPISWFLRLSERVLQRTLFVFLLLGVVLSCLHQSSLGSLMLIAPTKMHPLWFTPMLPLLFLLSAAAVGFPIVIIQLLFTARALKLEPDHPTLQGLARVVPVLLGLYLAVKFIDLMARGALGHVLDGSTESWCFLVEVGLFGLVPFLLLLSERVRQRPRLLVSTLIGVALGVAANRLNVFLVAYQPPFAEHIYVPAVGELAVSAALVAGILLCYRFFVLNVPVLVGRSRA